MAANEAKYKHGSPRFVDYTPVGAVLGGEVQVVNDVPSIPHRDIAASEKGAVATYGGVYEVTSDAAILAFKKVYWEATAGEITESPIGNQAFGWTVEAFGSATTGLALHMPSIEAASDPYVPAVAQQALTDAGAINVTSYYTAWTTTGAAAGTLADGTVAGQQKKVQLIVDGGGAATLTPVTLTGGTTITFADAGDYVVLVWDGSSWVAIELGNDADGATAPVLA